MGRHIDITGQKFGRLTTIKRIKNDGLAASYLCQCECGKYVPVRAVCLTSGRSKSCGCLKVDVQRERQTKHGYTKMGAIITPTYSSWRCMKSRCSRNKNYISKGITICEEWKTFDNFLRDMGKRPEGMTLERIDNSKGYYKENCIWTTRKKQANNRSTNVILEYKGERHTISEWADKIGMNRKVITNRYERGLPIERVMYPGRLHKYLVI